MTVFVRRVQYTLSQETVEALKKPTFDVWHWEHNEVWRYHRSIPYSVSITGHPSDFPSVFLSFCVAADAELSGVHVPWLGAGQGIQHEPHHTQTLAGNVAATENALSCLLRCTRSLISNKLSTQRFKNQSSKGWNLEALLIQDCLASNSLSSSWRFRRTTATTPSTTSVTASVLARWCMAWFTSATYR